MVQNSLTFSRELPNEPSCEMNSKSVNQFSRKSFKAFFLLIALAIILLKNAERFEAIFVDSHQRNIPV